MAGNLGFGPQVIHLLRPSTYPSLHPPIRALIHPGLGLPGEQERWDPALLQSGRGTPGSRSVSGPADQGLTTLLTSRKVSSGGAADGPLSLGPSCPYLCLSPFPLWPGSSGCCNLNTLSCRRMHQGPSLVWGGVGGPRWDGGLGGHSEAPGGQ